MADKDMNQRAELSDCERLIEKRLSLKNTYNLCVCAVIALLGIVSLCYKARLEVAFLPHLRELTVSGTVFTTLTASAFVLMNLYGILKDTEFDWPFLYYLRLSSTVTECLILAVVLLGLLPFVNDHPVIGRFDMFNMHILIPVLTLLSFVFYDPPIGKLKPARICYGLTFLVLYSLGVSVFLFSGMIPQGEIPYSFLNFYEYSPGYIAACVVGVYGISYLLSYLFYRLNRKASWLWFKDVARENERQHSVR